MSHQLPVARAVAVPTTIMRSLAFSRRTDKDIVLPSVLAVYDQMYSSDKWLPVSIAPAGVDLEVCVLDKRGFHALVFPVRKGEIDWIDASTKKPVDIAPTHWRPWSDNH